MSLFHSSSMTIFGFNFYGIEGKSPDFCLKINDQKFNCSKALLSSVSITVQKFVSKSKSHGCSCKIQDVPRGSDWSIVSRLLRNEKIEINSGNFRFLHKVAKSLHISSLEQATSSFIAKSRENTNNQFGSRDFSQRVYGQRYDSPKTPNKTIPSFNLNLNTSINNNNYNEVGLIPQSARSVQPYPRHSRHHHKNSPSPSVSSRHTSVASPPTRNVEFQLDVPKNSTQNKDNLRERTYDFEKGRRNKDQSKEKLKKDYERPNRYGNNNNDADDFNYRQNKYYNNDNNYNKKTQDKNDYLQRNKPQDKNDYLQRNKPQEKNDYLQRNKPQDNNDYLQRNKPKYNKYSKNNDAFEYDIDNDYNDHEVDDEEDISQKGKKPTTNKYDDILTRKINYDEDSASLALKNSEFQNYGFNRIETTKKFQTKYNDNQKDDKYGFNNNNDNAGKDKPNIGNNNDNNRYNSRFDNNNKYNNDNNNNDNNRYNRYPEKNGNDNSDKDNKYDSYSDYEEQYAWLKNNKNYSHSNLNRNRNKGKGNDRDRSPSRTRKSTSAIHKSKNDGDPIRNQHLEKDRYGDRNNEKKREVKIDLNHSYDHFNDNGSKHQQNLNVSRDSYRSRDALSKGSGSHHTHDHHRRSTSPSRHGRHGHRSHHDHHDHGDHRSHHSRHEHDRDHDLDKRSRDRDDRDIDIDRRSNGRKESRYPITKTSNSPNPKASLRSNQQNQPNSKQSPNQLAKSSIQPNPKRRSVSPSPNASPLQTKERSATPTVRFVIDQNQNTNNNNNNNNNEEEEVFEIQDEELGLENLDPDYDNIECLKTMETSFLKLNQANIQSVAIECINLIPSVSYQVICRAICYSYAIRYGQPEVFYNLAMKIYRRLNDNKFLRVLLSILDQPPPEFVNEFGFFKSCFSDEIQFINSQNNVNYYDINSNSGSLKKFKVPTSKNQIMAIIRRDDVESLKTLIKGSNVNVNKLFGRNENEFRTFANQDITMIEYAAFYGSLKVFKFLQEQKGIQMTDKLPMFAVAGGNFDIVKLCANECFFDDCPVLAAKFHRWEIFEWLIDVQQESYTKQHIFRTCLQFSNFRTLFKLIKRKKGKSEKMLTKAAEYDNLILYKYLLKLSDKEMKRILITIKRPHGGYLPIHYAVINQNLRFVKFLLDMSTDDVNNYTTRDKFELKVDPRLLAPIHFACKGGDLLILRLLLRTGKIDINEGAKGKNLTPLHIASKHGNTSIVKYLLKRKKIRVNEQTLDKRMTALHFACAKGFPDIVYALVNKKGIDKNLKNRDGRTAQQLTHDYEIVKMFK